MNYLQLLPDDMLVYISKFCLSGLFIVPYKYLQSNRNKHDVYFANTVLFSGSNGHELNSFVKDIQIHSSFDGNFAVTKIKDEYELIISVSAFQTHIDLLINFDSDSHVRIKYEFVDKPRRVRKNIIIEDTCFY